MNTKNKKRGKVVLSMMVLAAMIVTMMSTTLTAYAYNKLVSSPDLDGYSASVTASQSGSTETFTCTSKRRYPVAGDPNAKTEYLWEKNEHAGDWRYWYAVNGATTESHSVGITTTNSGGQHEYRCRVDAFSTAVYEYIDDAYVAILGRHGEKGGIDAWGNLLISHNQITHMRGTVVTNPENILITNEVASMAAALFFSQEWLIDSGRARDTGMKHGGFPLYQYDYKHKPFNEAFVRQCYLFIENSEHAGSGWENAILNGGGSQVIVRIPCNGQHVCVKMPTAMLKVIKGISESSSSNYRGNKLSYATPYNAYTGQFDWGGDGVNVSTATALLRRSYSSIQRLPITYSVAFDGNGATSGSTAGISMIANVSRYLTNNGFARTGYTFAGWATSRSGNVAYYNQASVNNLTTENKATVTLYAKWTPINMSMTYNANGGSGTIGPDGFTYAGSQGTDKNSFTPPTGYTFKEWNLKADGSGKSFAENVSYTGKDMYTWLGGKYNGTFYAQWKPIDMSMTYNANGGSGTIGPDGFTYAGSQSTDKNSFTPPTGYTFKEWNLKADGSGKSFAENVSYTGKDMYTWLGNKYNGTFYAQWKLIEMTITYDKNAPSATGGMSRQGGFDYGTSSVTLKNNEFINSGYKFMGWNTKPNGSGQKYAAGAKPSGAALYAAFGNKYDGTLYAQWLIDAKLTFDLNGGEYSPTKNVWEKNNRILTKQARDADGKAYYSLSLAKNGVIETFGKNSTDTSGVPNGLNSKFQKNLPDVTGSYRFLGWSTIKSACVPDAQMSTFTDAESTDYRTQANEYGISQDTTLYAVWEEPLTLITTMGREAETEKPAKGTLEISTFQGEEDYYTFATRGSADSVTVLFDDKINSIYDTTGAWQDFLNPPDVSIGKNGPYKGENAAYNRKYPIAHSSGLNRFIEAKTAP